MASEVLISDSNIQVFRNKLCSDCTEMVLKVFRTYENVCLNQRRLKMLLPELLLFDIFCCRNIYYCFRQCFCVVGWEEEVHLVCEKLGAAIHGFYLVGVHPVMEKCTS